MFARIFIVFLAPPVLFLAFFYGLIGGIGFALCAAVNAVGIELACIKRDWKAGTLKAGDE